VTDRHESGVLDTRAYIDLALLDPVSLPSIPELTAIASARGLPLCTRNGKDLVGLADVLQIVEV
jgi:hypothetical protein